MYSKQLLPLLLVTVLFFSCKREKDPYDTLIARKWKFAAIEDTSGQTIRQVGPDDYMSVFGGKAKNFNYALAKEGISSAGNWQIQDSSLIFTYDAVPVAQNPDSTAYLVEDNQPVIVYYKEGKEIARVTNQGVTTPRSSQTYKIEYLSEDSLAISEKEVNYSFIADKEVIKTGGATWTSIGRGLLGMISLVLITFLFSVNKRAVDWKLVGVGLGMQFLFAIAILKVPFFAGFFDAISRFFVTILSFTREGSAFLFGGLITNTESLGFIFAFQILPTIIFFSALTSIFFYLGILQKVVYAFAWIMRKTMRLSGSESLAAAGNIFLGQTESPLLIKPYIDKMNRSEILCLMVGGMATIAGGVLAAYIGFLGGDDPVRQLFFAKHLLAASVMSAPAAIVASKILIPQTEPVEKEMKVSDEKIGKNFLEAIANGTVDGLKLAINVGAMLLVFIALLALVNYVLKDLLGDWTGLNSSINALSNGQYSGLTLQFMLGYLFAPLSWLMGVHSSDILLVGQLLGEKTILNEFVAYVTLGQLEFSNAFADERSLIIATYILCGFANFASIGIQIGGIGALAPSKRTQLAELGFYALIGGTMASLFTAVVVGMLI